MPLPAAARFVLTLFWDKSIMAGWVRGALVCRCVGARQCSTRLGRDCTPPTTAVAPLGTVIFKDDPQGSCLYSSPWPSVLLCCICGNLFPASSSSVQSVCTRIEMCRVKACSPDLHLPTHLHRRTISRLPQNSWKLRLGLSHSRLPFLNSTGC